MKNLLATVLMLVTLTPAVGAYAAEPGAAADMISAKKFVQGFYTWYMKEEKNEHEVSLDDVAIKTKPKWFSDAIVRGIEDDEAASAQRPDEVVGLDFDPFLNSQEDCEPYKVGKATVAGSLYQVEVFGQCQDSSPKQPDVIAVVEKHNGAWVFVNFLYPGDGDLFSELGALKKERENPPR